MTALFGYSTEKTLPQEFLTTHEEWEKYVGHVWAHLLRHYKIDLQGTIIEIAPGNSMKIGFALAEVGFSGILYLVDPLECALTSVAEKYRELLPNAVIFSIAATLERAKERLPKGPDCILANHPLDDMLLAAASSHLSSNHFICTSKEYHLSRLLLEANPYFPLRSVVECWREAFSLLQPKTAILSQYPSLVLQENGIHTLNALANKALEELKSLYLDKLESPAVLQGLFNRHENYQDLHIGASVLNAVNWLVVGPVHSFSQIFCRLRRAI